MAANEWSGHELKLLKQFYATRMSYTEIGQALGRSRGAVAGQIARLRAAKKAKVSGPVPQKPRKSRYVVKGISMPEKAHPLVKQLIKEMNEQRCTWGMLSTRTNSSRGTFMGWRTVTVPHLDILEACFNALGKTLQPVDLPDDA